VTRILASIAKWILRQGVTLLLILAILVGAAWVRGELKRAEQLARERATLATQQDALAREMVDLKRGALERLKKSQAFESMLSRKRAERQKLWKENFWTRKIPGSDAWTDIKVLDLEIAGFERILGGVAQANQSGGRKLDALERTKVEVDRQISQLDATLAKSFVTRLATIVDRQLPIALFVLVGVILLPLGIKTFLYFVVAPWASGRPAMRLLPSAVGQVLGKRQAAGPISAVSIPLVLAESQELFIQPEYLQSTPLQAAKDTRWLLNWSIPVASLLSGMFLLTRIRSSGAEPVVVSSTRDPLSEIGVIELAEGSAFVCRPRALAGVIQDGSEPIRITRHWRVGLQAWLTLQFRFLAFHGPAQLILRGCRGVRLERAGAGRLVNQAATLGFSGDVAYGNARCETFMSYLTGKEELFNDLFTGHSGVFAYEETPAAGRTVGIGRPLQGFSDAILKAFGV